MSFYDNYIHSIYIKSVSWGLTKIILYYRKIIVIIILILPVINSYLALY